MLKYQRKRKAALNITTYHSQQASSEKAWLASLDFDGSGKMLMSFFADSEANALAKVDAFWKGEIDKQRRLIGKTETKADDGWGNVLPAEAPSQHHFAGKVWMRHNETKELKRIAMTEITMYEENGWYRSGPRGK